MHNRSCDPQTDYPSEIGGKVQDDQACPASPFKAGSGPVLCDNNDMQVKTQV